MSTELAELDDDMIVWTDQQRPSLKQSLCLVIKTGLKTIARVASPGKVIPISILDEFTWYEESCASEHSDNQMSEVQ
ncbi:hypothetical protein AKO1_006418 [Acrasis kona]|uniref:Uncharacterized protein n=1 Tax=Acrasis kona TaxID=1008807 RepID=A0AAW2YIX8_9EUKA